MKKHILFILLVSLSLQVKSQENPSSPIVSFKRGIGITAPDSTYSVNFRFRMQNRAMFNTISGSNLEPSEIEARVRRLRLRMEGFMYNPKITYSLQLSFSRGDMDWSVRHDSAINVSPNVVRDAAIFYRPNKHLQFIFGQTKLPGNRQRVISSSEQQFVDRSVVNALFNIDRDFGVQAYYFNNVGRFHYIVKTALTTGDGRNVTTTNSGLAYTGRLELLPLGNFTNGNDYFEGDLEREKTVKISLAGGYSVNEKARRTGGQIGRDLYEMRDMQTWIFDGLLKYRGYALYVEYIDRNAQNPFTVNAAGNTRYVITGNGKLVQSSYLFKNNFEIAARYANITPGAGLGTFEALEHVYTAGVTRYLRGHRLKLQGNISYHDLSGQLASQNRNFWNVAFQIEAGI